MVWLLQLLIFFTVFIFSTIFFTTVSHAEFRLKSHLTESQRKDVLKVLGLGSSNKNISTMEPLGTENGLELAIAFEFLETDTVRDLIADSQSQSTLSYPRIIIGKGLFDRTDLFFHFIPYTATFGISEFGAALRFNFLHEDSSPFLLSGLIHANSANFNNQLVSRNLGADVMLGTLVTSSLSVFTTLGWNVSNGKFVGGTQGVTDTLAAEKESVTTMHTAVGCTQKLGIFTLTASFDYYKAPVYSLKLSALY